MALGRIVRFYETGSADVLRLEEVESPEPGDDEVLLQVTAFGLNRSEVQMRNGIYPLRDASFPSRIGKEAVGVIEAIGGSVEGFGVGDRVTTIPCFDMSDYGVYGEWAMVPGYSLARAPEKLTDVQATAIWQQYLTAYGPLALYSDLDQNDTVLITAATSSVGVGATEMAKIFGAKVIATSRSEEKIERLRELGADYVIHTESTDIASEVMRITENKGVNLILDPIAGPQVDLLADCLAYQGKIFLYGQLDPQPTPFPLVKVMKKAASLQGYTLWELVNDDQLKSKAVGDITDWLESGKLTPMIDRVFLLDDIVKAHGYMESNQQIGKIVVTTEAQC